jgi:hypothetical protein
MRAVALSVSRQQSRRCSGFTIQRELSTSSTVTRSFWSAFGFWDACLLWATRHARDLRGRGAVLVHVAHERGREALPRAPHAEGHLGQVEPAHGLGGARPRAADADVRVAVHRAEERHRVAHPRLDGADGEADQRLGGGAAAHHVHVEVEPEAEIGRHPVGGCGVAALVGHHPVHAVLAEAGVGHRLLDRVDRHGAGAPPRVPAVLGFSHADDAVLVLESHVSRPRRRPLRSLRALDLR